MAATPAVAASDSISPAVGFVDDVIGDLAKIKHLRRDNKIALYPMQMLAVGDQVCFGDQATSSKVTLSLYGKSKELQGDKKAFCFSIKKQQKNSSMAGSLLTLASAYLKGVLYARDETVGGLTRSVEESKVGDYVPPSFPAWMEDAHVIKRKSTLLPWNNGNPPFQFDILPGDGGFKPLLGVSQLNEAFVVIDLYALPIGSYTLRVGDKKTNEDSTTITIETTQPPMPEALQLELRQAAMDKATKERLTALWLLKYHPDWTLEAYQRLCVGSQSLQWVNQLCRKLRNPLAPNSVNP